MMNEVQVLLAVHNGEKHLAELLMSLTKQEKCKVHLIVGFDSSTDNSELILQSFKSRFESVAVYWNSFGSHNANFNFLFSKRLRGIPLAFCDQDDLWLPTKVQNSLRALATKKGPTLVTSSVRILNSDVIIPSKVIQSQISAIFVNPSKGCTQVLNVELQELIEQLGGLSGTQFYDWWVYVVAIFFGDLVYFQSPSIEYRIHQQNTIGQPSLKKQFKSHLVRFIKTGSIISIESLTYLFRVSEISRSKDIQLSEDVVKLLGLLQEKRIRRLSILITEFRLHPHWVKNYILRVGIIFCPRLTKKEDFTGQENC
jgi:glycosyltransferase involved in cell wall biosynthesis